MAHRYYHLSPGLDLEAINTSLASENFPALELEPTTTRCFITVPDDQLTPAMCTFLDNYLYGFGLTQMATVIQ